MTDVFHRNAKSFLRLFPEQLWGVLKRACSVHLSILDLNRTEHTGLPRLLTLHHLDGRGIQARKVERKLELSLPNSE